MNKRDFYQMLTKKQRFMRHLFDYILSDKETFNNPSRFNQLQKDNRDKITDYFMTIKDKIKLEDLRFYSAHSFLILYIPYFSQEMFSCERLYRDKSTMIRH